MEKNRKTIRATANSLFSSISSPKEILLLQYNGVPIGEQVYDSAIKYKHATIWRVDEKVFREIENAVNCVDIILGISKKSRIVAGMFTHTTGVYHGVAVRTILSLNMPIFFGLGGLHAMYKYNRVLSDLGHLEIHIKVPIKAFRTILKTDRARLLDEALTYFKNRFGGKINDWDALRAFAPDKKLYKNRSEFFADFPQLDGSKKNIFVMLHAMNDDPHVQIQHIFKDYYEWFSTTLKIARSDKHVNWIFKQHPMIKFYPDDANLLGLFDLIAGERNIVYIDETIPFNQASIPVLADVVVTCAGTAGLEFASLGIPAIIAAGNSYAGFDFCYEPSNVFEYERLLLNVDSLAPLGFEAQGDAKILFYLIYNKLIPGYMMGFFPYMNHDEIKALSDEQAIELYLKALNRDQHSKIEKLRKFISNSAVDENAELYLDL